MMSLFGFFKNRVDFLEPKTEPARSVYRALKDECSKREGRSLEEQLVAEVDAVHREACKQADRLGKRHPSKAEIQQAETLAYGSADYCSKWARAVADLLL